MGSIPITTPVIEKSKSIIVEYQKIPKKTARSNLIPIANDTMFNCIWFIHDILILLLGILLTTSGLLTRILSAIEETIIANAATVTPANNAL